MSTPSTRKVFDIEALHAIGRRIREARGEQSQADFAAAIGVSRSALTNYEAGRRLPNDLIIKRISAETGVSEPTLLFGATTTPFEVYRNRVELGARAEAQKRPGVIPRFMISDDEYALIALLRLMEPDNEYEKIVRDVVEHAKRSFKEAADRGEAPIQWGVGYAERLENALQRGRLEHGYDPDFYFWVTFGEERQG